MNPLLDVKSMNVILFTMIDMLLKTMKKFICKFLQHSFLCTF